MRAAVDRAGPGPRRRAAPAAPRPSSRRPRPPSRTLQRYAVLANADNARDHKGNIARAYRALRALGFDERNIFVVSPKDRRASLSKLHSGVQPHPGQLRPGDGPACLPHARRRHGGDLRDRPRGLSIAAGAFLVLRHGELLPADLRTEVERLPARVIVIMDQCFSGGFVDAFEGTRSKAIVISDVDSKHETYCAYFARTFWDALERDHRTSVRQAFDAAMKVHQKELAGDPDVKTDGAYRSFNGFADATLN